MQSLYRFHFVLLMLGCLLAFSACTNDAPASDSDTVSSSPQDANNPNAHKKVDRPLQHLLDEYLEPYPDKLTAISNPEKDTAVFQAMEAYNAGRYAEAIDLFPNMATSMEQAGYIKLYQAISQLMADKEQDSFTGFQRMRSKMGKPFEISNWYLALNYIAFNNPYEARQKLEEIIADGAYPTEQAKALLEDLPETK